MITATPDTIGWPTFDPPTALAKLRTSGLSMFGGRDRNMYVDLSTDRLTGLLRDGHGNYEVQTVPQYDHSLGGEKSDVMQPTVAWIRKTVSAKHGSQ